MGRTATDDRRSRVSERFFAAEADRLARLCLVMAERFQRGGRLLACGASAADWSDARHVAVEFVHPVIVGKRALPALALSEVEIKRHRGPDDTVMAFGCDVRDAVTFNPASGDPYVDQELTETAYHVLWELVHVFFDHLPNLSRPPRGTGASSFLYPFLGRGTEDMEPIVADVRESILSKAAEAAALRGQTLAENDAVLSAAATALAACPTLLALGNGGSATDAMDAVADLAPRRALDLTADSAILTAIANDVGPELIFARQVIAYGRAGDGLITFSTSGSSANVLEALAEARRRSMVTVAFVGYDGGRIAAERMADHVIVTRSEHIPRIQEAQASAWHVLRERMG